MKKSMLALCAMLLVAFGLTQPVVAAGLPRLLVLDFEILDSSNEPVDRRAEHERRLVAIRDYITDAVATRRLYEVVDRAAVRAELDAILEHQYLRSCNGCEIMLARHAGADFVMLGKINKISTLIGSMDIWIKDVATDRVVYFQTFGFRGDTDEAWMRASKFFVESLSKKQGESAGGPR